MDKELLKKAYKDFRSIRSKYKNMEDYYKGETDAMRNYKMLTKRSNNRVSTNYIQNFIDEEVSYSVGNDAKYISRSGDSNVAEEVKYYLSGLSQAHDINLLEKMLISSISYEIYHVDKNGDFGARIVSATDGYVILDDSGKVKYFLHQYTRQLDDTVYLDVYDEDFIYHYNNKFEEVKPKRKHIFGEVPVGVATYNIEEDSRHKTIYGLIKNIQDSYETNFSDISNEISDFRNAYLTFNGAQVDEEDLPRMKELGILQIGEGGEVKWLIKNVNDGFIQNTLSKLEENMYNLTKHINHNDKILSATSSLAIKARLLGLQQKCKLNQKALEDCIKMRLKMLFVYLKTVKNKDYDYRDIKVVFTANLPSDDVLTANMISQLGDKISLETALSQLSFVENPRTEKDKILEERAEMGESRLEKNE